MIVACVGLLTGLKKTLSQVSKHVHRAHTALHENHPVDFGLDEATTFKYLHGVCRHSDDLDQFGPAVRCCVFPRVNRASNRTPTREHSRAGTSQGDLTTTCGPFPNDMCGHKGFFCHSACT